MSAIDNARAIISHDDARLERIRAAGIPTEGPLFGPRHTALRDLIGAYENLSAQAGEPVS